MVLAIDGQPVSSYSGVERLIAHVAAGAGGGSPGAAPPPAKRVRAAQDGDAAEGPAPSGAAAGAAEGQVVQGDAQPPQVQLTIFRAGVVQAVDVRCGGGALCAVPTPASAVHGEHLPLTRLPAGWARRTGWAPTDWCIGVARSCRHRTVACVRWAGCPSGTGSTSRAGTTAAPHTGESWIVGGRPGGCRRQEAAIRTQWAAGLSLPTAMPRPSSHPHSYGLYALHWVSEVNGQPTPDLDAFIAVVRALADGADARVRLVHFESNKSKVGGWVGG